MAEEPNKPAEEAEAVESKAKPVENDAEALGEEVSEQSVSNMSAVFITGLGLVILIIIVMLASDNEPQPVAQADTPAAEMDAAAASEPQSTRSSDVPTPDDSSVVASVPSTPPPAAVSAGDVTGEGVIERKGEGRHFYTTIKIPPGAETLYLSGSGARRQPDGSMGDMEQQAIDTFSRFRETLEAEGWSMSDIVQVRAFAVADEFGRLDFDGFNRGYRQFFGTEENPMKPVRSFVQIEGLVVPGWLVEIEIRAARMPE